MHEGLHTIGEMARLSGLPVATIRYYSDEGLVPPAARSPGGYRLYDEDALARLELVRTLRDLGVDLATAARVLDGAQSLAQVADRQAAALEARIQELRVRQAVLRHAAARGADPAAVTRAHRLAVLAAGQRHRMVTELIGEATRGLDLEPGFAAHLRSMVPDPPEDPEPARLEAWVELAYLVGDPGFRAVVRTAFERHAADRASGADRGDPASWRRAERAVLDLAGAALAEGVPPGCARARAVVEELVAVFAGAHGRNDDAEFRRWLAERVRAGADARVSRYVELLAVIDGRAAGPDPVPAARWFLSALEASAAAVTGPA
ncbi:MerR family transcriptional regulator [Actinoallomurus rhizosphaericola]|uniref:MerR family transcriptional regulator n=1 Tax=Actinoallomurus rhizosphaericola TaxID=2952536 RepID=UPI002092CDBF|nr:MerR family transcriptional regulator [Actinoallomurus rhizosphaericola]MCO5997016.1 MerR family transcriptional regulator [Actinoallomurus rhizosphaericola]